MNKRASGMADRFETASHKVSNRIAQCTDTDLHAYCKAEECTVAALACHIARVHEVTIGWVDVMLAGKGLADLTMSEIDQTNQVWFAADANRSQDEVLSLLDANRRAAGNFVRNLDDGDLDHTAPFGPFNGLVISVQTLIEQVLIGDPLNHLRSIEAALSEGKL